MSELDPAILEDLVEHGDHCIICGGWVTRNRAEGVYEDKCPCCGRRYRHTFDGPVLMLSEADKEALRKIQPPSREKGVS